MADFWIRWLANVAGTAFTSWMVWSALTALEIAFPQSPTRLKVMIKGALFWIPNTFLLLAVTISFSMLRDAFGWRPLISLAISPWFESPWLKPVGIVLCPFLGMTLFDFTFYWMHRAQHRFFWRFHAVHHAIEDLTAINSYPHWSEALFQMVFMTLPTTFIFALDTGPTAGIITLYLVLHGHYIHSSTRLNLGPIVRRVLADNRFHRLHHSLEPRHFDKNFGSATTLWDQLFGTACWPEPGEWPAVGLSDAREPEELIDAVVRPFQRRELSLER